MATAPGKTLLLLSFLVIVPPPWSDSAYAQSSGGGGSRNNSPPPPPYFNARFNPSMAILIVILITAFFFMGFFSIYLRNCGSSSGDGGSGTGRVPLGAVGTAARSRRAASRGLDPAVIATFPTLVYSDVKEHKLGKGSLECAVCLSEFDDDEELRLLPNCSHAFHPDCIDTWLASHTTCPVCRDNLATAVPVVAAPADAAEPTATAAGTDGAETVVDEEQAPPPPEAAEGSVGSRSRRDQERPADHVVVDIPTPPAPAPAPAPTDESMRAPLSPYLSSSASEKRSGSVRGGIGGSLRGGSVRGGTGAGSLLRSWRSRSARPTVWAEDDRERFTLRLPEYVRRDVMSGKLNRSRSLASFPVGAPPTAVAAAAIGTSEGGSRRGYRAGVGGEGSSRGGGWRSARFGWVAKSDRWASFARQLSSRFGLGGNGNGGGDAAEGSTTPRKADAGEGSVSTKGKAAGNGEKKGAGVGKSDASAVGKGGGDESTLPFARV